MSAARRSYYPVFFDLTDRLAVVVGDGTEAVARATALRDVGARVRVCAVGVRPDRRLRELAASQAIELRAGAFERDDLEGAAVAIACADDATNRVVREAATALHVPLNVIDQPQLCDWIHGSVVRRGALLVAISTSGTAPALAVRLKERLLAELGPEYGRFLELAAEQRPAISASGLSFEARRRLWYCIADSDVLAALRAGDEARARAIFAAQLAAAIGQTQRSART